MGKGEEKIMLMEIARWEFVRDKNKQSLALQHSFA